MDAYVFFGPHGATAHAWPALTLEQAEPGTELRKQWSLGPLTRDEQSSKLRPGDQPWERTLYRMQRNDIPHDEAEAWLQQNDVDYATTKGAWRGFLPVCARPYSRKKPGRPKIGLVGEMAERALTRALPHYTLDELSTCCRMRARSGRWLTMRDELARAMASLPLNRRSAAEILRCTTRTVDRLHQRGVELTHQERLAVAIEQNTAATERNTQATERLAEVIEFRAPTDSRIEREVEEFIRAATSSA